MTPPRADRGPVSASPWLARSPLAFDELLGGIASAVTALVLVPLVIVIVSSAVGAMHDAIVGETSEAAEEPEAPPVEVMETRFVRLGAPLDRRAMPDRYVPSASSAPRPSRAEELSDAPADPTPGADTALAPDPTGIAPTTGEPATSTTEPRPVDARDDLLTRLGDRAEATAEFSQPRVREGDAEGIAEGTATRDEGDIYLGRLYTYFRRGWQAPTSIPDAELSTLTCSVSVTITADARVGDFRVISPSGNEAFDASVRQRMAQAAGAALPEPPAEEAERFLGRAITLRFLGRHAR